MTRNLLKVHALLSVSLFSAASAQYCTGPDNTGRVSCSISGPAEGVFLFPAGVSTFTLEAFSSGNGGGAYYPTSGYPARAGGYGAEITGAVTLNTMASGLRYIVGGNGGSVNGEYGSWSMPVLVRGPPRTGDAFNAGTGGGPSWLPDYQISLGGGGGAAVCGSGGSAIADGSFSNSFWAGEDGQNELICNEPSRFGGGAPAAQGATGRGGSLNSRSAQPGQPDGSGGNAAANPEFTAGGGGGSMTGAGGGAVYFAPGVRERFLMHRPMAPLTQMRNQGAGNSQAGSGVTLQRRRDTDTPPVLQFFYTVSTFSVTSTVTSTLPTVTTTSTALTTSTASEVIASQLPLSTSVVTVPMSDISVFTARRTKTRVDQTVTVTADLSTSVAQATTTGPATCELPAAVYPSACCPASWIAMQAYSAPSKRSLNGRKLVELQRRTGSTMLSSTVSGLGNPTSSTITVTSIVLSSVPDVRVTATSTVVLTSTSISTVEAGTTTSTAFAQTTKITIAAPGSTLTVKTTKTLPGPVTTVTSTTTVPSSVCRLNAVYTASQCVFSRGGVDPAYKKRAAYELQTLKKENGGRQIAVDCGSAGTFLY